VPIKVGPNKTCAGVCGQEKDRYSDFAPRWGHCKKHKPWDETCDKCQTLRALPTRQPRCYECDKVRDKRRKTPKTPKAPKKPGKGKGKGKDAAKAETSETSETSEAHEAPEKTPEPEATATKEPTAALIPSGTAVAVDAHGPLTRAPFVPKRGIAVHLRRGLKALRNRCKRVAAWENAVGVAKERLAAAQERDDGKLGQTQERLAAAQAKLSAALVARSFTRLNVDQLVTELKARTLTSQVVKTRFGFGRFEALLRRVDDIVDSAYVQANGDGSSEALTRIMARVAPHYGVWVAKRVRHETMRGGKQHAEEAARAARDAAIFRAVTTWDPDHKEQAALSTHCGWSVMRALQVRTKADRAEGVLKGPDGWRSGATSLDLVGEPSTGQESYEPYATTYATKAPQKCGAATQDAARREAIALDVGNALTTLGSDDDRTIARLLLIEGLGRKAVGKALHLSGTALNTRIQVVLDALRDQLVSYESFGWSDGSDE